MRLGIITSSYPLNPTDTVTAGVFVRDLAHELARLGHQVHVLTPRKSGRVERSEGVAVHFIPWWGGEKDLASLSIRNPVTMVRFATLIFNGLWVVSRKAHSLRLEATLAMWAIPSGIFSRWIWQQSGIPYGVWALGSDIWARHKYPFGDRIVRAVLRDAAFRFADGLQLAEETAQLAGKPCEFVPSVRQLNLPAEAQQIELSSPGPHFLFIGRYELNKGPDVLVEAMRLLLDRGQHAHLHLFGVGSLEEHLSERRRGYEQHIHLHGFADPQTVIAYMNACDWLVIPSRIESIPLIFVDSVQMRIPVIATQVGDLGELVRRYRVGMVVPPADVQDLAAAMQTALTRPRAALAGDWQTALETFSLRNSALRCSQSLLEATPRKEEP